jgi:hypothetical protein
MRDAWRFLDGLCDGVEELGARTGFSEAGKAGLACRLP